MYDSIMVTGSSGKLGSLIVQELQSRGQQVVPFDITSNQEEDILNQEVLKSIMTNVDAVLHLAAIPHPDPAVPFEKYFEINVQGTLNIFKTAVECGVKRIIYSSSIGYYGVNIDGHLFPECFPINEKAKIASIEGASQGMLDAYNQSKVMSEQICSYYGTNNKIETIVLRLAPANDLELQYPPDEKIPYGNYHEKCFWCNVDTVNVVQAFMLVLERNCESHYEVYNIANEFICDRIPVEEWRNRVYPDVPCSCKGYETMYGIEKAKKHLNYSPTR